MGRCGGRCVGAGVRDFGDLLYGQDIHMLIYWEHHLLKRVSSAQPVVEVEVGGISREKDFL
jgi:hypothetical protein